MFRLGVHNSNALSSQVPMASRAEAIRKPGKQKRGERYLHDELKEAELGFIDAQARRAELECFKHSIFAAVPGGLKLKPSRSEIRKKHAAAESTGRARAPACPASLLTKASE
jgi:hypothetical protein